MHKPPWLDRYAIGGAAICVALLVFGLLLDARAAVVNALTEASGVFFGAALTALFIERQRKQREAREQDKRWRARLEEEIAHNLGQMLRRVRTHAVPHHGTLSDYRESIVLPSGPLIPGVKATISSAQASAIFYALPPRVRADQLRRSAVDAAIADGVFVTVVDGKVSPSELHKALVQVRDDLGALRTSTWNDTDDWVAPLMLSLSDGFKSGAATVQVEANSLLKALAYYDRIEDLFQSHVAALRLITEVDSVARTYPRRPTTPFGEAMAHNIRAERVTTTEVLHLVRQGLYPFGERLPADMLGNSYEEQVASVTEMVTKTIRDGGIDPASLGDDKIDEIVRSMIEDFAKPEDGIPLIERLKPTN